MSPSDPPAQPEAPADAGASRVPEDVEVEILPDGRVRLHARCRPGEDPAACALRLEGFVAALGVPPEAVLREVSPPTE